MGLQKCCGQESCTENDIPPKNDRRCQLINEVREIIGNIEYEEKAKPRQSRRPDRGVPGMRDLDDECRQWRKRRDCTPPLITAIALHETRPTSDYTNMKHENSSQVTYLDATNEGQEWRKVPPAPWDLPRSPSQELRAGELYSNCRCLKRDGLQHDCPRWECGGRPECVAVNPGPCCIPSQWPKPIRGDRRYGNKPSQREESVVGTPSYGGKQLRTGPLNPEICIPIGSQQHPQGPPGGAGQEMMGFIAGGRVPQQGMMGIIDISNIGQMQQGSPQPYSYPPFHANKGNVPSKTPPATHAPQRGGPPMDVVMVLDLDQVHPGAQNRQLPQRQEASQDVTLTGPGVTCFCRPVENESAYGSHGGFQNSQPTHMPMEQGMAYCRPVQSEPGPGGPRRYGMVGIPMAVASSPMP